MTVAAILNLFGAAILEIAAAIFAQKIERAITEKAIEIIVFRQRMAREILAFKITEKPETILHINLLYIVPEEAFKSSYLKNCLTNVNIHDILTLEEQRPDGSRRKGTSCLSF